MKDEVYTVTIPDNLELPDSFSDEMEYEMSNSWNNYTKCPVNKETCGGFLPVDSEGRLHKRLERIAWREHGISLSNATIELIANVVNRHNVFPGTYEVTLTHDMQRARDFQDTCYSKGGEYQAAFQAMDLDPQWFAIVVSQNGDDVGRAWATRSRTNLKFHDGGLVLFNSYHDLGGDYALARIVAEALELPYHRATSYDYEDGDIYFNSRAVHLVGPVDYKYRERVWLGFPYYQDDEVCCECDSRINADHPEVLETRNHYGSLRFYCGYCRKYAPERTY